MPDRGDGGTLTLRLEFEAVDTLFFRDARPFEAASRAASGLPTPQTLAGALRTTLLERHGVAPAKVGGLVREGATFAEALMTCGPVVGGIAEVVVKGPWFGLGNQLLVPAPANLRREKETGRLVRLDPLASPPPGWRPPMDGMLPLWRWGRSAIEPVDGYLTMEGLRRFLEGGAPEASDILPPSAVYAFEDRTGIGIDDVRGAAGEGRIYGIRVLAPRRDAVLVAETTGPARTLAPLVDDPAPIRLGGEGRYVRARARPGSIDWPDVAAPGDARRLVLLTTPAWFGGWRPDALRPVSAAVPGYEAVSGWDLARGGPKPNRFMVPAGTVYFLAGGDDLPPVKGLVAPDDAAVGWGHFVEGNWSHA